MGLGYPDMRNLHITIEDDRAIEKYREEWDLLLEQCTEPSFFSTREWLKSWISAFSPSKTTEICVAKDGGEVVGIMPFNYYRNPWHDLFCFSTDLGFGNEADYNIPLIKQGTEDAVFGEMLDAIVQRVGKKGIFTFDKIPVGSKWLEVGRKWLMQNAGAIQEKTSVCPRLKFEPTYEAMEKKWKGNHRTDIRRQLRRLNEIGELHLKVVDSLDEFEAVISSFITVFMEKWQAEGKKKTVLDDKRVRNFYRYLGKSLIGNGLHLSYLSCRDSIVSYHFGFLHKGWLYYYKPTYLKEFQKYSPGKVHIALLVQEGIQKGWQGIDFLQGSEPYKYQWTREQIETPRITAVLGWNKLGFRWKTAWKKALWNKMKENNRR